MRQESSMTALSLVLVATALTIGSAVARDEQGDDQKKEKDRCEGSKDVAIVNAKVFPMDAKNSIASSVTIKNGKIAAVGHRGDHEHGPCMRVIDARGRTVVPGLIDNHNHIVQVGHHPGHDNRLD